MAHRIDTSAAHQTTIPDEGSRVGAWFADMGALAPLSRDCPLWSERLAVIPWVALTHRF